MNSNKPVYHLTIQELRETLNVCGRLTGCAGCPNLVPGSIGTNPSLPHTGDCRMDMDDEIEHVLDTYIPPLSIGTVEYITRVLASKLDRLEEFKKEIGTPFYDQEISECSAALLEIEKYRHAMEREAVPNA